MTTHPDFTTAAAYMDEAMKAIALAKQALLGGADAALFVSSGPDLAAAQASPGNPYGGQRRPLIRCRTCGNSWLDEQDCTCTCTDSKAPGYEAWEVLDAHVPGLEVNERGWPTGNYVSPYSAGSAAEVAEGVEPAAGTSVNPTAPGPRCAVPDGRELWFCHGCREFHAPSAAGVAEGVPGWDDPLPGEAAVEPCGDVAPKDGWRCAHRAGHRGDHIAFSLIGDPSIIASRWPQYPILCPAQWGEPPETMLCSLASGHDGNHATAEGIEWGGRWETAEPHGGAR